MKKKKREEIDQNSRATASNLVAPEVVAAADDAVAMMMMMMTIIFFNQVPQWSRGQSDGRGRTNNNFSAGNQRGRHTPVIFLSPGRQVSSLSHKHTQTHKHSIWRPLSLGSPRQSLVCRPAAEAAPQPKQMSLLLEQWRRSNSKSKSKFGRPLLLLLSSRETRAKIQRKDNYKRSQDNGAIEPIITPTENFGSQSQSQSQPQWMEAAAAA